MVLRMIRASLFAAVPLALSSAPADAATHNFGVSGFERVRVDGPFIVRLATGVAPYARASGPAAALDSVSIAMQGRTLVVKLGRSSPGGYPGEARGPVEIAIGTHELSSALLNGSGSLAIDRVRGQTLELGVQGSGAASVESVRVDELKAGISGSGSLRIGGTAAVLNAVVRGLASLDAAGLAAKDAVIGAEGAATVRAQVGGTARIEAQGPATVTLTGSPACTSRLAGSASVSGCRETRGAFDRR